MEPTTGTQPYMLAAHLDLVFETNRTQGPQVDKWIMMKEWFEEFEHFDCFFFALTLDWH